MKAGTIFGVLTLICLANEANSEDRYPVATWSDYSGSSVNISIFVFRDLNFNGLYDWGDRPMSGILVDAIGSWKSATARSNLSGFANFEMSASDSEKDITFAGKYQFQVAIPDRWRVTTGNALQTTTIELRPGAPSDLVALPPPVPVGLAPELRVQGSVAEGTKAVEVMTPDGGKLMLVPDEAGRFEFAASPGLWTIFSRGGARQVEVNSAPVVFSSLGQSSVTEVGDITTVGFDDVQVGSVFKVPSGYNQLEWENFVAAHQKIYPAQGYRNNILSGEFVAYNGSGHPASIWSERPFDFVGGYVGASNLRAEGETLHVRAWRDETLAYSEELTLSALGPIYFAADFKAVTRIDFSTEHYWQATFDNLEFRLAE